MKEKKPVTILITVVLMILLGLARGLGGVVLIMDGKSVYPETTASPNALVILGIILLVICISEIVAAVGIYALNNKYRIFGFVATILFFIDGLLNGYVIFGSPQGGGTAANSVYALIIIAFLVMSGKYFREKKID